LFDKEKIHGKLSDLLTNRSKVFTLGGAACNDVKRFIKKKPKYVRTIERNKSIFNKHVASTNGYPIKTTHEEFSDWVNNLDEEPAFDLWFLDFNGNWSSDVERSVECMFNFGKFKKGCHVALTINKKRDYLKKVEDTMCYLMAINGDDSNLKGYFNHKEDAISRTFIRLAKFQRHKFIEAYRTTYIVNKTTMMFWLFKKV
jgi:hypothetical protein